MPGSGNGCDYGSPILEGGHETASAASRIGNNDIPDHRDKYGPAPTEAQIIEVAHEVVTEYRNDMCLQRSR